jgi:hypothetical protein
MRGLPVEPPNLNGEARVEKRLLYRHEWRPNSARGRGCESSAAGADERVVAASGEARRRTHESRPRSHGGFDAAGATKSKSHSVRSRQCTLAPMK